MHQRMVPVFVLSSSSGLWTMQGGFRGDLGMSEGDPHQP